MARLKDEAVARVRAGVRMGWPEIVATSRVYTEPWLARFLLANALGGRWLAMHGDDPGWPELVRTARAPAVAARPLNGLRLIDPCCGAGHILLVAAELLGELYGRERALAARGAIPADWATPPEEDGAAIAASLAGTDVDASAVEVCRAALAARLGAECRDVIALQPGIGALARGTDAHPLLRRRWDVVCTNPPYAGFRQVAADVRAEVEALDPHARSDLCVAFVSRCLDLADEDGTVALLTPAAWLASTPATGLRRRVLEVGNPRIVASLGQRTFPGAPLVFAAVAVIDRGGAFTGGHVTQLRATGPTGGDGLLAAIASARRVRRGSLETLTSRPFVVEVDDRTLARSVGAPVVGDIFRATDGVWPRGADLVRHFTDVDPGGDGWVRMSGGQGYARWYAGAALRVRAEVAVGWAGPRDGAVEYPRVAGGRLCARMAPDGSVARAGIVRLTSAEAAEGRFEELLAIFNTPLGTRWLRTLSSGLNFNPGYSARIPLGRRPPTERVVDLVRELVAISRHLATLDRRCDEFAGDAAARALPGEDPAAAALRLVWEPQARLIAAERELGRAMGIPAEEWSLLPPGCELARRALAAGVEPEAALDALRAAEPA